MKIYSKPICDQEESLDTDMTLEFIKVARLFGIDPKNEMCEYCYSEFEPKVTTINSSYGVKVKVQRFCSRACWKLWNREQKEKREVWW